MKTLKINLKILSLAVLVLIFSSNLLKAQSGELEWLYFSVDKSREQFKQVKYCFEIKDKVLRIYDLSSGGKELWREYNLKITIEESEEVLSYDTGSATIRLYLPELTNNGYKGRLELNIVHDRWDYWTFVKLYR